MLTCLNIELARALWAAKEKEQPSGHMLAVMGHREVFLTESCGRNPKKLRNTAESSAVDLLPLQKFLMLQT